MMSWFPEFEIGFWNAWVLMLYLPLHPLIMLIIDKAVGVGEIFKKMEGVSYEGKERKSFFLSMTLLFVMLIYSVFLPLRQGSTWLYVGFVIYSIGLIIFLVAIVNIVTTPHGKPFTEGIYRYSRHPMLFSSFITFVGISIATASWIFFLLSLVASLFQVPQAKAEERGCLDTFGADYREYMKRTPRWVGFPK